MSEFAHERRHDAHDVAPSTNRSADLTPSPVRPDACGPSRRAQGRPPTDLSLPGSPIGTARAGWRPRLARFRHFMLHVTDGLDIAWSSEEKVYPPW